jgi:N-acetyl-anhydromuramyl-L-alanine amidase AmpD
MASKLNYTPGPRNHAIDLLVIHTMECQELPGVAKRVAAWFMGATKPEASANFTIDNKDTIPVVDVKDIAWHAGDWTTNVRSIGYELAGKAAQTATDWKDPYSLAVLDNAARRVGADCKAYKIPVVKLTPEQVKAGAKGICGHIDVSKAFAVAGGHTDPGTAFPWTDFLALVKKYSK